MNKTKTIYYLFPLFLMFLMVVSILLNTNLFVNTEYTFAVWFILMLAAFAVGKFMYPEFNREKGIKVILIVTVIAAVFDIGIVAVFNENFSVHKTLIGNLVLYSLRVAVLGFSAVFGLFVSENLKHSKSVTDEVGSEIKDNNLKEQTEFFIKEAKLKAEKILFDAEKEFQQIKENKTKVEIQLRELIQTEREIIRKYESEEENKEEDVE